MSRVRGIVPLVLATAIGVGNGMLLYNLRVDDLTNSQLGIWIFGPAFKEQRELKDEEARLVLHCK